MSSSGEEISWSHLETILFSLASKLNKNIYLSMIIIGIIAGNCRKIEQARCKVGCVQNKMGSYRSHVTVAKLKLTDLDVNDLSDFDKYTIV